MYRQSLSGYLLGGDIKTVNSVCYYIPGANIYIRRNVHHTEFITRIIYIFVIAPLVDKYEILQNADR
jgi:hypothetical protein